MALRGGLLANFPEEPLICEHLHSGEELVCGDNGLITTAAGAPPQPGMCGVCLSESS